MIRHGSTHGQFDIEHPTTHDTYTVHVIINYSESSDSYDTPGSFEWDYGVEWVEDFEGNVVNDTAWLTHKLMNSKLQDLLSNIP